MVKISLGAVSSLFLVANSISLFSLTSNILLSLVNSDRLIIAASSYFGALILSAIIGATLFGKKLKEKNFLLLWTLSGVFSCLLFFFLFPGSSLFTLVILSLILGLSVGIGIPNCLALLAEQTRIDKRGRLGAISFFTIQVLTAIILLTLNTTGTDLQFLFLSLWRLAGIAGILRYSKPININEERKTSIVAIIKERNFILYFLPWFLFTLVNFIEAPILEGSFGKQLFDNFTLVAFVISSFSAIVGGFLCDLKGRKVTGILGFVFLGLGYAFLSFLSENPYAIYLYLTFDGVAWGILYVTFIFVIWGDLSESSNREKYYLLGGMPFLFSGLIQVLVQPFAEAIKETSTSFSLASFFLFVAILPLLYAPESLPEKVMKDRDLNSYVNKALEKVEKEGKKDKEEEAIENITEESSEDEEARKLAEKYY